MNAFVLAGGQSTRMGRDKALIEFHGRLLIEHSLAKLRALGLTPSIAGNRPDLARFAPIFPDNYPGSGPLAGIEAALAASREDMNLFLPVDIPAIPVEFLRWMAVRAEQTAAIATVPYLQGRPQPLCAVYHRVLLPHAQAALAVGDAKVMRAIEKASLTTGSSIDAFDVEVIASCLTPTSASCAALRVHCWFHNLNTPADLKRASLEESPSIH